MSKALKFIRLDFITIKPYFTLKDFLILFVLPIFITGVSGGYAASIGLIMMLSLLYIGYPFALGEKSGMDTLYSTLSIGHGMVVFGRYLFAQTVILCAAAYSFIVSFATLSVMGKAFNVSETLVVILAMTVVFEILQALQLPIYFKFGYSESKVMVFFPVMALGAVFVALKQFILADDFMDKIKNSYEWVSANSGLAATLCVAVCFVVTAISYSSSLSFYRKREF